MKAILIDDEENAIISLELAIKEFCPGLEVIGTAISAAQGIKMIREKNPDVVFLDIQMPHMNGIELLENFGEERNFDVIFVTAFDDFAIKAFRLSATDYLLKPLSVTDLTQAVKRLLKRTDQLPSLNQRTKSIRAALYGKIALPTANGSEFIPVSDIIRIQADGSYSTLYFTNRKQHLVSKNLKEFELALSGESFFRTHKSHLVNLKHVTEYLPTKDGGKLTMRNGSQVEISRTHKTELAAMLANFTC